MKNDLDNLIPLMQKKGVTISKEAFHHAVNTIFHNVESKYYDKLHHGMDDSLQEQFNLLGRDVAQLLQPGQLGTLKLLDIGCGTGMSTDKLLKSPVGKYISEVYLLDTSKGMLDECKKKAALWGLPFNIIEGDIFTIETQRFEIILTSSVLHHIPNLPPFLGKIAELQQKNGFFIHLQDPNGDHTHSTEYLQRVRELKNYNLKATPGKIFADKIKFKFLNIIGKAAEPYIAEVNDELTKAGIIKSALSDVELWSVTDLHVENETTNGNGISFAFLKAELQKYTLVKQRSYNFHGAFKSVLPPTFQKKDEDLIAANQLDGQELAAVWHLKP